MNFQEVYSKIFKFMINHNICEMPLNLEKVSNLLNTRLIPLTHYLEKGLTEKDIFDIWGNNDGVVQCYNSSYAISYNETKGNYRCRFTIAEELGHIILGHTRDTDFNMFHQSFSKAKYNQYDREARICAGFLLMPPNLYYSEFRGLPVTLISEVFQISISCAKVRCDVYEKFRNEICENIYFNSLPKMTVNLKGTILEPLEVS